MIQFLEKYMIKFLEKFYRRFLYGVLLAPLFRIVERKLHFDIANRLQVMGGGTPVYKF